MASERLASILNHVRKESGLSSLYVWNFNDPIAAAKERTDSGFRLEKHPDDIVITLALRTALAKGFKGSFRDSDFGFLVYSLLKEVNSKSGLDPDLVEDICVGNVN